MKEKLRELIPVLIIIHCLIAVPVLAYKYNLYLNKPAAPVWNEAKKYLSNPKIYNNEPIVFNPNWLKNYATDYGRFEKFNIVKNSSDFDSYWLVSINKKSVPKNYLVIEKKEIKNLFIFKLKKQK